MTCRAPYSRTLQRYKRLRAHTRKCAELLPSPFCAPSGPNRFMFAPLKSDRYLLRTLIERHLRCRVYTTMTDNQRREWVDPDTGYRVVRLSDEPGSSSLYFNYNGYTPEGDILVISTRHGLDKVHMESLHTSTIMRLDRPFKFLFVGLKYRRAYYQTLDDNVIHYVDIDTGKSVEIAQAGLGDIQTINCDETLLGGVQTDPDCKADILRLFENRNKETDQFDYRADWPDGTPMSYADAKEVRLNDRLKAEIPMQMFVIGTADGVRRNVYGSTDWLNHLLFSPTDPNLLM